jgi:hypothetical protein
VGPSNFDSSYCQLIQGPEKHLCGVNLGPNSQTRTSGTFFLPQPSTTRILGRPGVAKRDDRCGHKIHVNTEFLRLLPDLRLDIDSVDIHDKVYQESFVLAVVVNPFANPDGIT